MSDTVWIVTSGSYSDYSVCAVCSTKENAELVAAKVEDANDLLEIELDAFVSQLSLGKKLYNARVYRNQEPRVNEAGLWRDSGEATTIWANGEGLFLSFWAHDEAEAVKIAADKKAQWLAEEAYGVNPR